MKIDREREGENLILRVSGRLETSTAPKLQEVIDNELQAVDDNEQEDLSNLQIDMEQLEYVSSAGLRVLLSATRKMNARGGTMVVENANANIQDVFKITGFDTILTVI